MARSTYIYVPYAGDTPLGFFTVKREMMNFLRRYFPTTEVTICRYRDGEGAQCSVLDEDHRENAERS